MDIKELSNKLSGLIKKYRYPIVVALIGVVLLTLPGKKQIPKPIATAPPIQQEQPDLVQQLTRILEQISGVGKVQVLLTVSAGETTVYQHDEDMNTGDAASSVHKETVIITDSGRNQQALVVQTLPPQYQGAIIVCQGADQPAVKLAVVEAVSKATGLRSDQISVLKMK